MFKLLIYLFILIISMFSVIKNKVLLKTTFTFMFLDSFWPQMLPTADLLLDMKRANYLRKNIFGERKLFQSWVLGFSFSFRVKLASRLALETFLVCIF